MASRSAFEKFKKATHSSALSIITRPAPTRYTLLSHRANLTLADRRSLQKLLRANKRLGMAYLPKEEVSTS